jgi:uncharacterized protein YcbX
MRVAAINRYPVKSMQGEQLDSVEIGPGGLDGDRRWGIVDRDSGKVWSAKRHGELLEASAVTTADGPEITLPDGSVIEAGDATRDAQLSEWLGSDVSLLAADDAGDRVYEATIQLDTDTDVFDMPMAPGKFLDLSPVHLVTTASLRAGAAHHPDGMWSADRFRPSIVVDVEGDDATFAENEWVGHTITVGEVSLEITMPMVRCVMTTRVQPTRDLPRDLDIYKTLNRVNQQNLGVCANVASGGRIAVGDGVSVASGG